jgi:hypothetical protein
MTEPGDSVDHAERVLRDSSLAEDAKLILWHLLSRIADLEQIVADQLHAVPDDPMEEAHRKLVERVRSRVTARRP